MPAYHAKIICMKKIEIPLKCECEKVQGNLTLRPRDGNHFVCHCDDCQAFARFLKKEDQVLTKNLGTELFQVTPDKVTITNGKDRIACMRLGPKGLFRWYAKCCNSPIGNTIAAKVPFIGIIDSFMDFSSMSITKEEAIGEVEGYVMCKYAVGELPNNSCEKYSLRSGIAMIKLIAGGFIFKRYSPNQLFNLQTGRPIVEAEDISKQERQALSAVK